MATSTPHPVIKSSLDLRGEQFKSNYVAWAPLIQRFEDALQETTVEGNAKSIESHHNRGQLLRMFFKLLSTSRKRSLPMHTARDRVSLLLDPDSPFLELCSFAGYASPDSSPCASLVVGIGSVRFLFHNSPSVGYTMLILFVPKKWEALSDIISCSNSKRRCMERDDRYLTTLPPLTK